MAKKTATVEDKLRTLYQLQVVDSKIDKIQTIRGELPLEVEDLEDEIEGLNTRVGKLQGEIETLDKSISDKKNAIEESKALIKKYEGQQNNVRNNREYDALSKEIEFQGLEIQLSEKRIKENMAQKDGKQIILDAANEKLSERSKDLEHKKSELDEIVAENVREEELLNSKSTELQEKADQRLLKAYLRIRGSAKNGLAIVPIDREASAGSFIKIPPQRQLDIAARKRIIVDEHSGRLLVDAELAVEETERMDKLLAKALKDLK